MNHPPELRLSPEQLAQICDDSDIEFLDFGCSRGASIEQARKMFGAKGGLGIDIATDKIKAARAAGFEAVNANILELPEVEAVRFVTLVHFLEHLEGHRLAQQMLERACSVSREFVFLRQPFFDSDGALLQLGFKTYWSDWSGHRNPMTTLQLFRVLRDLQAGGQIESFTIGLYGPIKASDDPAILPVAAPEDQHQYDPARHPPKHAVPLGFPVFREVRALITKAGTDHEEISRKVYWHHTLVGPDGKFCPVR